MINRKKTIRQKIHLERNKEVWILKNKEGEIIDKFRQKQVATKEKTRREKDYFEEGLILERDNYYIDQLKKRLKNEKQKKIKV